MAKLFSEACERNQEPIRRVLDEILPERGVVWEIGSGTGQHAAYFAKHFPSITWQPSDLGERHESVRAWTAGQDNVSQPLTFDLLSSPTPVNDIDGIVCINTIHIAPWEATQCLFDHGARALKPGAFLFLYGPFRYRDRELEPSNESFDRWLEARDPRSGIRTFEDVDAIAHDAGFRLAGDVAMPANNHSIWWKKQ